MGLAFIRLLNSVEVFLANIYKEIVVRCKNVETENILRLSIMCLCLMLAVGFCLSETDLLF